MTNQTALPTELNGPFLFEGLKVGLLFPTDWQPAPGCDWLSSLAQERGLPGSSSWFDLAVHDANKLRMKAAKEACLPASSTWQEIMSAQK